ncbi:transposase family protein [Nostoc punctiforme UO1]
MQKACLSLFHLLQMPTFQVLGMLFGVSKTGANDTFHY